MHSHLQGHPALLDAVKKLERLNPDQFELYFSRKAANRIEVRDGKVETLTRSEDVGLAVRIIKDRRLGFSFSTSLDDQAVRRMIDAAHEIALSMPEDEFVGFHAFGSEAYPEIDTYDSRGLETPVDKKVEMAQTLEAETKKADPRIRAVRTASLSETAYETHMIDSNGEKIQHRATLYSAAVACKAEDGGDAQMGYDFNFSNYLDNLDIQSVAQVASSCATELLNAGTAPSMKCPAVLRNSQVAALLGFLASSFSAEEMSKGRSMLAGKKGSRVFSDLITIIDDGLLAGGYGTSPFDGEGVPSSRTVLIDGGFLSGALYDQYYARKLKTKATGSASRGIKGPPTIGPTNLYLQKGKKSLHELCGGISQGIFITQLMGVHTANRVTGEFSLGASGILIENGQLTRPVRGFAVAGNVMELFRGVTDIGSDLRFYGDVGAPSLRIREISVGGM